MRCAMQRSKPPLQQTIPGRLAVVAALAAPPPSTAVVAVMLPTLLSSTAEDVTDFGAELALSRFESVLMLVCYGLFLVFQLVTHRCVLLRAVYWLTC